MILDEVKTVILTLIGKNDSNQFKQLHLIVKQRDTACQANTLLFNGG